MKKNKFAFIFLSLLLIISQVVMAQNYLTDNVYGTIRNRNTFRFNLGMPNDTFAIPFFQRHQPHIAAKGNLLYVWDTVSKKWNQYSSGTTGWPLVGATGVNPATNWLGTNDTARLVFKVNGIRAGLITPTVSGNPAVEGGALHLGQYAGESFGLRNSYSVFLGHGAARYEDHGESVIIGNWAAYYSKGGDPFIDTRRMVAIGQSSAYRTQYAGYGVYVGPFAAISNHTGRASAAFGPEVLKSNTAGSNQSAFGLYSLYVCGTGIGSITVTNGGSGYTDGVAVPVTITAPLPAAPGVSIIQAVATAVISGGVVQSVTVTEPGLGYSDRDFIAEFGTFPKAAATITSGSGTGAVLTVNLLSGDNNSGFGVQSGWGNTLGRYNNYFGSTFPGRYNDYITLVGHGANVNNGVSTWGTKIVNATAIGKNARVDLSNSLVLGGTGSDAVSVGIGTATPSATAALDIVSTTKGVRLPVLTTAQQNAIPTPVSGLIVYNSDSAAYCFYNGSAWKIIGSNAGSGSSSAVDSLWRTPGVDSIKFKIGGINYSIKDSTGGGGASPTVGTYSTRIGSSPSNGTEFFQTDIGRDAPDGKYYYLNSKWHYVSINKESLSTFWNEFQTILSNQGVSDNGLIFWAGNSGTISYTNTTRPGVARFATSITTNGYSGFYTGAINNPASWINLPNGTSYFKASINIPTLSTGSERYAFRIGLANGMLGDFTSGVYLEYDESQSANWRIKTANFGTRTTTTSSTAVATGWQTVELLVNSNATSVEFWVNGTSLGTITTNIPGAGNGLGPAMIMQKSAGTTSAHIDVDYLKGWQRQNTDRN